MTVRDMLRLGDFNFMSQTKLADGTVEITLTKYGDPHVYWLWVRDLYKPTEVVIREEVR